MQKWIEHWLEVGYEAVNIYNEKPPWQSRLAWRLAYRKWKIWQ